jgi:hypothetical protein
MSEQEREVAARIKFSLAEASLLHDHLKSLIEQAEVLRSAIGADNGLVVMRSWNQMGDDMNYVGTLLNLKGSAAARQWIEDTGQGE